MAEVRKKTKEELEKEIVELMAQQKVLPQAPSMETIEALTRRVQTDQETPKL